MTPLPQLPAIIGICGPARAGKDTIARTLMSMGYVKDSFAAPIRQFVASICGLTLEQLELVKDFPSDALNGKTPRYAMQTLGTEWGRKMLAQDLWINYLMRRSTGQRLVVPDIRFENEAQAILNNGGLILKVVRPGVEIVESTHSSEAGIPDNLVGHTFVNDKGIEELGYAVTDLMYCHFAGEV